MNRGEDNLLCGYQVRVKCVDSKIYIMHKLQQDWFDLNIIKSLSVIKNYISSCLWKISL